MGIIGFVAKAAGTVILTGTGVASTILESAAEMSGSEQLAELMCQGREGSFNTIRKMWTSNPDSVKREETPQEAIQKKIQRKEKAISDLRSKASTAKRVGNIELSDQLHERMDELKNEISELKEELSSM